MFEFFTNLFKKEELDCCELKKYIIESISIPFEDRSKDFDKILQKLCKKLKKNCPTEYKQILPQLIRIDENYS